MKNIVQDIFALILLAILILVVPVHLMMLNNEERIETHTREVLTQFTDTVRSKGYMDNKMYITFLKDLSASNISYSVELVHSRELAYPLKVTDPEYTADKPWTELKFKYGTEKILQEVKTKGTYKMQYGDDFYVVITQKHLSSSGLYRAYLLKTAPAKLQMQSGGKIKNEEF